MFFVKSEFILLISDEERLFAVRLLSLKLKKITGSVGNKVLTKYLKNQRSDLLNQLQRNHQLLL